MLWQTNPAKGDGHVYLLNENIHLGSIFTVQEDVVLVLRRSLFFVHIIDCWQEFGSRRKILML